VVLLLNVVGVPRLRLRLAMAANKKPTNEKLRAILQDPEALDDYMKTVKITGGVGTGKASTPASDILRFISDETRFSPLTYEGVMEVGSVGAGKTKPRKRSKKQ
jgi:hypothetical protein